MKNSATVYQKEIRSRSRLKYIKGLLPRFKSYLLYEFNSILARSKGASVGKNVSIPYQLAKIANQNLTIGDNTSIQSFNIDLRAMVKIGSNVIIGSGVQILTCSHDIDSPNWEHKSYGITIDDYAWIATNAFILPSCRNISKGAVCAAGSVVFKNVDIMSVVSGNPAQPLRLRKSIHTDLCIQTLRGNDLIPYIKAYNSI